MACSRPSTARIRPISLMSHKTGQLRNTPEPQGRRGQRGVRVGCGGKPQALGVSPVSPLRLQVSALGRHRAACASCRAAARRPVHLPRSRGTGLVCTFHGHGYGQHHNLFFLPRFRVDPVLSFSLRSGAVVILTSAARSGGEVRITEAERPRHVRPGRRAEGTHRRWTTPVQASTELYCQSIDFIRTSTGTKRSRCTESSYRWRQSEEGRQALRLPPVPDLASHIRGVQVS